jgi:hypothetical protein
MEKWAWEVKGFLGIDADAPARSSGRLRRSPGLRVEFRPGLAAVRRSIETAYAFTSVDGVERVHDLLPHRCARHDVGD